MVDIRVDLHQATNLLIKYLETQLLTEVLKEIVLHSPVTKNFMRRSILILPEDKIWAADFVDMQLICIYRGVRFLLCVILKFTGSVFGFSLE